MYGRSATVRSSTRSPDPVRTDFRRHVATALARRFRSTPRPVAPPPSMRTVAVEVPRASLEHGCPQATEPADCALDVRVRETGEW
jgi:hypothetical protein